MPWFVGNADSTGSAQGRAAFGLFVLALAVYGGTAVWSGKTASPATAQFDRVAEAWLSGRLHLEDPPDLEDLTLHEGRWYSAFSPLPAALLVPWVALAGVEGTSTVAFSVLVAAGSVSLVFLLLCELSARGWIRLGLADNLWLTAMFAVGTVHWYVAADGQVWFVAQTCTVFFSLMAVWLAARGGSGWWAGAALAAAVGTRTHVVLLWPLIAGCAAENLRDSSGRIDRRRWLRWCAESVVPIAAMVAALSGYNLARFGNPTDFGYATMNVDEPLAERIRAHGIFDVRYVPRNLRAMLLNLPVLVEDGGVVPNPDGMSVLFTTPAWIYAFRSRIARPLTVGAWLAVAAVLVPLLTYNNTGYWQFGYRFSLDFIAPVMILVAVGAADRVSWIMRGLIMAGVLVNLWGVRWWY